MNRTRKSTDVAPEGAWRKSSYSSGSEGNCLETADVAPEVAVRDSKNKQGPALVFPSSTWAAFVAASVSGEFDSRA